jgi:alpha,alpha-trehalase
MAVGRAGRTRDGHWLTYEIAFVSDWLPPSSLLPELFQRYAMAQLEEDTKAFADSRPRAPIDEIMASYRAERPESIDELQRFVQRWFAFPDAPGPLVESERDTRSLAAHIDHLWSLLVRRDTPARSDLSRIMMPSRYIVPGGIFRESYYWDTYFSLIGMVPAHHELIADTVRNLAFLVAVVGHIPNGNRTYYVSRSQPPFFYLIVGLLDEENPASAYAQYLPQLLREHAFWMDGEGTHATHRRVVRMPGGEVLNRYWDDTPIPRDEAYPKDVHLAERMAPRAAESVYRDIRAACESGWDFSSRWFDDQWTMETIVTTSVVPVDLNSLLYGLERAIADGAQATGDVSTSREFNARASARAATMQRYLWNESIGLFDDFDLSRGHCRGNVTPAGLMPLFVELASPAQASRSAALVTARLLAPGGLLSSERNTGQQWDAPNGWAPLQWIAVSAFARYGFHAIADTIADRWVATVERVYRETGRLVEKYDVVTARPGGGGEYELQDGFGWTNGVTAALLRRARGSVSRP